MACRRQRLDGRHRCVELAGKPAAQDLADESLVYALVTEYADGGSLWDLLGGDEATDDTRKPLDEKTVKTIATDVLEGLAVLHEHGIVHRDIKPQNILRCDDLWKIADFGII